MSGTRALGMVLLLASSSRSDGIKTDVYGDPLPPGAVARLGTIRLRHADADVAFTKDGKQLISCGCDGEVRVWDVADGRLLRRTRLNWKPKEAHTRPNIVALSPDGGVAAACGGKSLPEMVYLFDTATGKERGRFPIDRQQFDLRLMFSPDGKYLAIQSPVLLSEWSVQIWDVAAVKKRLPLMLPPGVSLARVAFSTDSKQLAAIARKGDGTDKKGNLLFDLLLWDLASGRLIRQSENLRHLDAGTLAFSPHGKWLAVGAHTEGIRLLDTANLKPKRLLKPTVKIHAEGFTHLAFSPDGRRLAAAYLLGLDADSAEPGVLVWDLLDEKRPQRLSAGFGTRLVFAPDSETLAGHDSWNSDIHLWDAATGRPLHPRSGHSRPPSVLTASPDGKMLASIDPNGILRLWDAATSRPLRTLKARNLGLDSCLFSGDGRRVIAAGRTGSAEGHVAFQAWDVATGKAGRRIAVEAESSYLFSFGISVDGRRLAAVVSMGGDLGEQMIVWDSETGKQLSRKRYRTQIRVLRVDPKDGKSYDIRMAHAAFAPDGESVIVWRGDRLGLEEVASGCSLAALPQGVEAPLIFSPDGRFLSAAIVRQRKEKSIYHYDTIGRSFIETASGQEVFRLDNKAIEYIAFAPNGQSAVVADKKRLCVLDTAGGEPLYHLAWPESIRDGQGDAEICSLAMLSGARVATGMHEGDILIWDLAPAAWMIRKPMRALDGKEPEALWADLFGNARVAYRAVAALAATPTQALPLLKDRLQPVTIETKRIEQLLADLSSDSFAARTAASREMSRLRYWIEPILRRTLRSKPSLEMRRRIEMILAEPKRTPLEALRMLRAIAVLERIGTPEAQVVLEKLSKSVPTPATQEAQAALQRLKRR